MQDSNTNRIGFHIIPFTSYSYKRQDMSTLRSFLVGCGTHSVGIGTLTLGVKPLGNEVDSLTYHKEIRKEWGCA
jgi:hypothetical protein